jgi:AraC-like DNA-binding protein
LLDFETHVVGLYQNPHDFPQGYVTPHPTLSFATIPPESVHWGQTRARPPGPYISLVPGGVRVTTRYLAKRRNWAAVITSPDIRGSANPGTIEIRTCGVWRELPWMRPVPAELVANLEVEWQGLRELFHSTIFRDRIRLRAGLLNMIARIFDKPHDQEGAGPADHLKQLIDADTDVSFSLEELSCQCRYSADHLRLLFREAFGTTPLAYRNQRRMAMAMELAASTHLSVKEIAARTGFAHMSHLSAMFRREFSIPPSEAIRRFRS